MTLLLVTVLLSVFRNNSFNILWFSELQWSHCNKNYNSKRQRPPIGFCNYLTFLLHNRKLAAIVFSQIPFPSDFIYVTSNNKHFFIICTTPRFASNLNFSSISHKRYVYNIYCEGIPDPVHTYLLISSFPFTSICFSGIHTRILQFQSMNDLLLLLFLFYNPTNFNLFKSKLM